jgi:hypothetical protein
LKPPRDLILDFFQDWASARYFRDGRPVYMNQEVALHEYLGSRRMEGEPVWNEVNAHPPTSVLLYLPFAGFDYPDAVLAWNMLSLVLLAAGLWLLLRQLAMPFAPWTLLPLVTILLVCCPVREQFNSGQPNLILMALIVGAWAADRSDRPYAAGVLLGLATAVKLFPGFLFLYFVLQRRWRPVLSGAASFLVVTLATMAVMGPQTYLAYITEVIPQVDGYRSSWGNASLSGFWSRLFDPAPRSANMVALFRNPALSRCGTLLSCAALVAVLARVISRSRSQVERDQAFGLAVTAMLLISPITWNHYFIMLALPVVVLSQQLSAVPRAKWVFWTCLAVLWVPPDALWFVFMQVPVNMWLKSLARPVHSATVLSAQLYALLGLFAVGVVVHRNLPRRSDPDAALHPVPLMLRKSA